MKNFDELYNKTKQELPDEFSILETTNYFRLSVGQILLLIVFLPILITVIPAIIFENYSLFIYLLAGYIAFFIVVLMFIGIVQQKQDSVNAPEVYKSVFKRMLFNYNNNFRLETRFNSPEEDIYKNLGFFEKVSEFHMSDRILGYLDNDPRFIKQITMCDIKVYGKTTDTSINDDFVGLFCIFHLPFDTQSVIALRSDVRKNSFTGNVPKLEMDNQTFEKKFDVYASDKILAMRIFTADFMQYILDYHDGINPPFVFTLNGNKLLIRLRTGRDSFDLAQKKRIKKMLEDDFSAIDTAYNICNKIYSNISEKEL